MMYSDFSTTTNGKWILAGEHAVVRGHQALVFPVPSCKLVLNYKADNGGLSAEFAEQYGEETHLLFWSVMEKGMQLLGRSIQELKGQFHISSTIPVGAGMGASAALSVAVARWFHAQGLIAETEIYTFAKSLEDMFHGKSSGLDIAGVNAAEGIYFHQGQFRAINMAWQPHWYLSSCDQLGVTSRCIDQVNKLWEQQPEMAMAIDQKMIASVEQAEKALSVEHPSSREQLSNAIHAAAECFQEWGLLSENLKKHMDLLKGHGAIAVKPTGSGGGGYVLSLWNSPLSDDNLPVTMIRL